MWPDRHEEEEKESQNDTDKTQEEPSVPDAERAQTAEKDSAQELEELREKVRELQEVREQAKRIMAEYLNYKSRVERETAMAAERARRALLSALLPCISNFMRALEALCSPNPKQDLREGLQLAVQGLLDSLKRIGVEPILPQGENFDPRYHEAVLTEERDDVEPNTVLDVVEPGWLYREGENEHVLIPAKVKVSRRQV